ncbi:MAG: hypothetical protein RLZZ436_3788 [Planctomycetota bacterium]|jgi:hypothetical protein
MRHFAAILTLCLTQFIWLSSASLSLSTDHACGVDCISDNAQQPSGSVIEAEFDESEFPGDASGTDVYGDRPEQFHTVLTAAPVPSRPIDARGCRPPPSA